MVLVYNAAFLAHCCCFTVLDTVSSTRLRRCSVEGWFCHDAQCCTRKQGVHMDYISSFVLILYPNLTSRSSCSRQLPDTTRPAQLPMPHAAQCMTPLKTHCSCGTVISQRLAPKCIS